MEVQPDFRELLAYFNRHGVEYVIVGAYALAFHGSPRSTGDIDILLKATPENGQNALAALEDFGFGSLGLKVEDLAAPDLVIQLGVAPVRIDLLTSISGVSWAEVAVGRAQAEYGDVPVWYLGKNEFIQNKRASGRKKDLADIEALGEE